MTKRKTITLEKFEALLDGLPTTGWVDVQPTRCELITTGDPDSLLESKNWFDVVAQDTAPSELAEAARLTIEALCSIADGLKSGRYELVKSNTALHDSFDYDSIKIMVSVRVIGGTRQ